MGRFLTVAILTLFAGAAMAGIAMEPVEFEVDDVARQALILEPQETSNEPSPLVFLFHGHGGSAANIVTKYDVHTHWPEAIVVAPQGLATRSKNDPGGERSGWQSRPGVEDDRDIRFFDVLLAHVSSEYDVDKNRTYVAGHSNGGGFTYLIASQRPGVFAAIAPSAAASRSARNLAPMPVLHIAGLRDQLVPIRSQRRVMGAVREINECKFDGDLWGGDCRHCESDKGTPLIACIHDDGHRFTADRVPTVIEFFKIHRKNQPHQGKEIG